MDQGLQTIERVLPDEVPLFGGARARRIVRRRKVIRATSVGLCLLLCAGAGFVLTERNHATVVTVEQAVKDFRAARPTGTSRTAAARAEARSLAAIKTAPATISTGSAAPHAAEAAPYALPAEGVYTYETSGGESISLFGASHTYPDETTATVRHLGGCMWEDRSVVLKEHTDERKLCSRNGQFLQFMQSREVEFFGQRDGQTYTCPPELQASVAEHAGATSTQTCTADDGSKATIKRTYVGREATTVGGTKVDAVRLQLDVTMSGRATGTAHEKFLLSPVNGLPLRWERTIDTMAHATFGGNVRYRENATFVLESLDPQR